LAIASILKDHIILLEKKTDIRKRLIEFRRRVNLEKEASDDAGIKEYHFTIAYGHTSGRENRTKRVDLVNKLILPYVIPRDAKRGFTKEQRQLIWDMSKNKLCAICHKKVTFDNYSVDHKIPHSKGGLTVISNGEVTHRIPCNPSKGNRLK